MDEKRTIRRLSYSSAAQYSDCAERWRLSRVYGLDKATYWVTLMGTAVHEVTEAIDLDGVGLATDKHAPLLNEDVEKAFTFAFDREKARCVEAGTTINASGRVLKTGLGKGGGPNKKDEEWARHYGPIMVQNWIDWRKANNYKIALFDTADGKTAPGIELKVSHPLGGYPYVGYIDRILVDGNGELLVVDLKKGNPPQSTTQLKAYAAQLRAAGVPVAKAAYWMGMDGDVLDWVPMTTRNDAYVETWLNNVGRGLEAGIFPASPGMMCKACPVREYCSAVGGERAGEIPPITGPVEFLEVA